MCTEHLSNVLLCLSKPYPRASHAFPNEPISTEEGSGPAVQRIADHACFLNGPSRDDDQAATENATVVELAVLQAWLFAERIADGLVVLLGPAFLQANDVRGWRGGGELVADFRETLMAKLGEEFQAPAIEADDADLLGSIVGELGVHCGGCGGCGVERCTRSR